MVSESVVEPVLDLNVEQNVGLAPIRLLLDRWHADALRYCHWKSNEHVAASVTGETDLDVLVDPDQADLLQAALADCGFRRFQASAPTAYPGVEDYLTFDPETCRIVHLHLHYTLTLGQKHLKGYRLPWEARAIDTRVFDEAHGIFTTSPDMEMLLHLVRDGLKRRMRSAVAERVRGKRKGGDFHREFAWLGERTTTDQVAALGGDLLGDAAVPELIRLMDSRASDDARRDFAPVARRALAHHRTFGRLSALPLALGREAYWVLGGLSKRKFHWALPLRRVSPRGGVSVALLGSDGSGKSTTCQSVVRTFSSKIDVAFIYFGSGDGASSLLRLPLVLVRRVFDRNRKAPKASKSGGGRKSKLRQFAKLPWALSLALEKRGKLKRMIRARNRGLLVVTDRFPQDQVLGFNDGPLLSDYAGSSNAILRRAAEWEAGVYAEVRKMPPDIVVKLSAPVEVASTRRPEMDPAEISRRIDTVAGLTFPDGVEVLEISTDQPREEVLAQVCEAIWRRL